MTVQRARKGAFLTVEESAEGVFQSPSGTTDGVLVENPTVNLNPQNTETDEWNGSLDPEAPIVGGIQPSITFRAYLKGSGTPGTVPQLGKLLKIAGLSETIVSTSISGTTFSITGTDTINDSANGLAALTVGTAIALIIAGAFIGEFRVSASAAAAITVTKMDGSAPGLTNAAAGPSFDIRRGVAAVQATAGLTSGFTAQAPWAATADLYRGLPVWLSVNPATPYLSAIDDYTAARVARIAETLGAALDNTTLASIPPAIVYQPSDADAPSHSSELYFDGKRYKFAGVRGDASFVFNAAGACWADFRLFGKFIGNDDAAVPAPSYDATRPGTFRASRFTINRAIAALRTFNVGLNNNLVYPPNPNDEEGWDTAVIERRRPGGSMDPRSVLNATRNLLQDMRDGQERPLHARVTGGPARFAGNRFGIVVPRAFYESFAPGNDQGINNEQTNFKCNGRASGFQLAFF